MAAERGRSEGAARGDDEDPEVITPDVQLPGGQRPPQPPFRLSDYEELVQVNIALLAENRKLRRRSTQFERDIATLERQQSGDESDAKLASRYERDVQGLLDANLRAKERQRGLEADLSAAAKELRAKDGRIAVLAEELRQLRQRSSPASTDTRPTSTTSTNSSVGSGAPFRSVRPPSPPRSRAVDEDSIGVVQALQDECRGARRRIAELEAALRRSRKQPAETRAPPRVPSADRGSQCTPEPAAPKRCGADACVQCGLQPEPSHDAGQVSSLRQELRRREAESAEKDVVIRSLKALLPRMPAATTQQKTSRRPSPTAERTPPERRPSTSVPRPSALQPTGAAARRVSVSGAAASPTLPSRRAPQSAPQRPLQAPLSRPRHIGSPSARALERSFSSTSEREYAAPLSARSRSFSDGFGLPGSADFDRNRTPLSRGRAFECAPPSLDEGGGRWARPAAAAGEHRRWSPSPADRMRCDPERRCSRRADAPRSASEHRMSAGSSRYLRSTHVEGWH
eukprot:TRINITY_DN2553_c0_g2_i1.p1 TRINITY_DN2553_c0_g2~~TRINITY_DN2553_c0_g2_i1.p1  ORF type:complete len:534 (+),score=176.66 TRINITY_DN2553_c0_g2_i1:66-1604(+)